MDQIKRFFSNRIHRLKYINELRSSYVFSHSKIQRLKGEIRLESNVNAYLKMIWYTLLFGEPTIRENKVFTDPVKYRRKEIPKKSSYTEYKNMDLPYDDVMERNIQIICDTCPGFFYKFDAEENNLIKNLEIGKQIVICRILSRLRFTESIRESFLMFMEEEVVNENGMKDNYYSDMPIELAKELLEFAQTLVFYPILNNEVKDLYEKLLVLRRNIKDIDIMSLNGLGGMYELHKVTTRDIQQTVITNNLIMFTSNYIIELYNLHILINNHIVSEVLSINPFGFMNSRLFNLYFFLHISDSRSVFLYPKRPLLSIVLEEETNNIYEKISYNLPILTKEDIDDYDPGFEDFFIENNFDYYANLPLKEEEPISDIPISNISADKKSSGESSGSSGYTSESKIRMSEQIGTKLSNSSKIKTIIQTYVLKSGKNKNLSSFSEPSTSKSGYMTMEANSSVKSDTIYEDQSHYTSSDSD